MAAVAFDEQMGLSDVPVRRPGVDGWSRVCVALAATLLGLLATGLLVHASAHARPVSAGVPSRCVSSQLSLSLPLAEGAAGKRYWVLALRNVGARPCHLHGYPGVGLLDSHGRLLSYNVARRGGMSPKTLVLVPGTHAWFTLEFEEGGFCSHQTAFAGLRVYPPGSTGFVTLHHKESACIPPSGQPYVTPVRRTFLPPAGSASHVSR
ncbi:MAG TPA: DUF4232 domain-containing protein [Solirubrobacteraceae bacterium]|nr:DUF4232 domain-containing protein [Solirubrobacteraceae bacterium]